MGPARFGLPHESDSCNTIRRAGRCGAVFAAALMAVLATALLLAVVTAAIAPLRLTFAGIAVAVPPVAAGVVRAVMRCRQLDPRSGPPCGLRQLQLDQFFDVAQERHLLVIAERHRGPVGAGAGGSADPMHVALGDVR